MPPTEASEVILSVQVIALWIVAICFASLLPFTAKLGKLYARFLYSKYFFSEDIYVYYKKDGKIISTLLIRKGADGSVTQQEIPINGSGDSSDERR